MKLSPQYNIVFRLKITLSCKGVIKMKPRYDSANYYQSVFKVNSDLPCYIFANQYRNPENQSRSANWHEELELQYIIEGEGYLLID